jgi:hypothetical protein
MPVRCRRIVQPQPPIILLDRGGGAILQLPIVLQTDCHMLRQQGGRDVFRAQALETSEGTTSVHEPEMLQNLNSTILRHRGVFSKRSHCTVLTVSRPIRSHLRERYGIGAIGSRTNLV